VKNHRVILAIVCCGAAAALWPADAAAQRRGRPVRARPAVVVASPVYHGYYPRYDPFFWGYPGWYPYGFYAPYYRGDFYYRSTGSARIQATPKQAEVYVDGYLAGTVNDFDGFLQRLEVPAGEHEIALYLEGYRTVRQKVLFRPRATLKIRHALEPLAPGDTTEPRPRPDPAAAQPPGAARPRAAAPREREGTSRFGTLAIRFQPHDATLLVDGDEWDAPAGPGPLTIELGEGTHDVEVRKDGFTTYRTTVQVRGGDTVTLNVSLSR
jgi:hypothetical protein